MKKVISFSLWGSNPKYTVGAVKNAILAKEIYLGWESRFYCGTSVPQGVLKNLEIEGANVILMPDPGDWTGMFWRFLAASDNDVDVMISRDADSRLSNREKAAVDEWLMSGKSFHIMRDHPYHNAAILGGMWGVKAPALRDLKKMIEAYAKGSFWQVDQNFLRDVVYPIVRHDAMVHDEFFEKKPWPVKRDNFDFIGKVFDENDATVEEHVTALKKHLGRI